MQGFFFAQGHHYWERGSSMSLSFPPPPKTTAFDKNCPQLGQEYRCIKYTILAKSLWNDRNNYTYYFRTILKSYSTQQIFRCSLQCQIYMNLVFHNTYWCKNSSIQLPRFLFCIKQFLCAIFVYFSITGTKLQCLRARTALKNIFRVIKASLKLLSYFLIQQ